MNLPTWILITIFSAIRTFYLTLFEAFLVWGIATIALPQDINFIKIFVVISVPTLIVSIFRVSKWFND